MVGTGSQPTNRGFRISLTGRSSRIAPKPGRLTTFLGGWRMATVTFDHVWKKYGEVTAVKDLNLDIQDEEFLVLVGPSGCGKTTALRMIAGLEEISEGTVKISDRVVNDLAPKDRDVAMVFQSYALYPHMTVRDNLA